MCIFDLPRIDEPVHCGTDDSTMRWEYRLAWGEPSIQDFLLGRLRQDVVEPTWKVSYAAWEAAVLPLNYIREFAVLPEIRKLSGREGGF
jgi:hypothetical protein